VKQAQKTNAARLLDQMGIHYELREYEVDPDDLAAETVAAKIGLPPEQVFKTLVARGERNGIVMAVIPGDQELNLKALAAVAGERKIQLVPVKELQSLTGYIRGRSDRACGQARLSCVCGRDYRAVRCCFHLGGRPRIADFDSAKGLSARDQVPPRGTRGTQEEPGRCRAMIQTVERRAPRPSSDLVAGRGRPALHRHAVAASASD